jgi:acyl-CoA synthetase (AMP-forming)/AMP-acid ligase II
VSFVAPVLDAIRAHARAAPDHPALCSDRGGATMRSRTPSWSRASTPARRASRAGLARGARCGLVARQGAGFVEHALSVLAAGGCLVPIPDDATGPARERFADAAQLHHVVAEGRCVLVHALAWRTPRGIRVSRAGSAYLRFTSGTTM